MTAAVDDWRRHGLDVQACGLSILGTPVIISRSYSGRFETVHNSSVLKRSVHTSGQGVVADVSTGEGRQHLIRKVRVFLCEVVSAMTFRSPGHLTFSSDLPQANQRFDGKLNVLVRKCPSRNARLSAPFNQRRLISAHARR